MTLVRSYYHEARINLWRLSGACLVVGLVAGLGAAGFLVMLEAGSSFCFGYLANYFPISPGHEAPLFDFHSGSTQMLRWVLFVLPVIGGLFSGLIIFTFAPEAEGHGTDAAIDAYHHKNGLVRARVPFIKALTSMLTIGTGGSGGREGPIAQIGSGFASILGGWLNMPPGERRLLMAAGMAAGIGAIFHAPLAGAIFAAEVLYQGTDMEHEVLVPSFLTSITAYSVFGAIFGFHPLFLTPDYHFTNPLLLGPFVILGLVSAAGSILYIRAFYGVRHVMFHHVNIPNHFKPALGGVFVGIIGLFIPEALGTGYGVLQACFSNATAAGPFLKDLPSAAAAASLLGRIHQPALIFALLLTVIAIAKIFTTAFAIGSGGSGGVFGPAVVIGGALGAATGFLCRVLFPELPIQPGAFTIVGMAGFFAGAANTPISTIIMVSEMAGNYNLLLPAMLVCITSYLLCRRYTLYEKQLLSRLDAPTKMGSMARAILLHLDVGYALSLKSDKEKIPFVPEDMSFADALSLINSSKHECFPVIDSEGRLSGTLFASRVRKIAKRSRQTNDLTVANIKSKIKSVSPEDSLFAAINLMIDTSCREIIVVSVDDSFRVISMLSQDDIVNAYNSKVLYPDYPSEYQLN